MCGKPAELTPLGALLCPTCQSRDQVHRCIRCGQRVVFAGGWAPPDHPELVSRVCSTCRMRERADGLPAADVEAILAAASGGILPAVMVVRERLGWSLNEAVSLVHVLRDRAEPLYGLFCQQAHREIGKNSSSSEAMKPDGG
jgi:hypothetical protein